MSIDQLKSLISSKGGVAQSNQFMVQLPALPFAEARELNILCRTTTLPGRQILTNERLIGPKGRKVAYSFSQEEVNMSFLVLNDYGVKKYFEHWQNQVFDQETYQVNYKNEYAKPIKIMQLKKGFSLDADVKLGPFEIDIDLFRQANVVYEVELYNAFPTTMNEIQLSNEQNGLIELNVSFAFDNWKSNVYHGPTGTADARATIGLINKINNIFN